MLDECRVTQGLVCGVVCTLTVQATGNEGKLRISNVFVSGRSLFTLSPVGWLVQAVPAWLGEEVNCYNTR